VKKRIAVLLVNLGSPDSPKPRDVYTYLTQFLNDRRVIDINWLGRLLLVNGIIVPFRHRKSAAVYQKLWTPEGSPLIAHGKRVRQLLETSLAEDQSTEYKCYLAMRYRQPSIENALKEIQSYNPDQLLVLPLFPQYASASTGSVIDKVMRIMRDMYVFPKTTFIHQFYDHPLYIKAFVENGAKHQPKQYDHVIFSFHGLPERQVDKVYDDRKCKNHSCEHEINDENKLCYKATCYATSRMIAEGLGLDSSAYTVAFQSRLGKGWIGPFSDQVIQNLAKAGKKKLLVYSPAFIADCLETTIEIGEEYQELFEESGGEKIQLVESLNDSPTWIRCLTDLVKKNTGH
jgi:ferrochelatase